jgi:hypothetical protein
LTFRRKITALVSRRQICGGDCGCGCSGGGDCASLDHINIE